MPRARRNNHVETPAPAEPATHPAVSEWKGRAHSDGDLRIPKELRAKLGIAGHSEWTIHIVEQSETSFTLSFQKSA